VCAKHYYKDCSEKIRENGSFCCNALKAVSAFVLFLLLSRGKIIFHGGTLFSLFFVSLVFVAATFIRKEKVRISQGKYAGPSGTLMGLGNYITLLLSSKVRETLLFPMTTVFLVVLNTIASKLIFKDKLTVSQAAGIIIGVISVILIK